MESLKCLNQDSISLLQRNSLLRPLIQAELIKNELRGITLDKDLEKETITNFLKNSK